MWQTIKTTKSQASTSGPCAAVQVQSKSKSKEGKRSKGGGQSPDEASEAAPEDQENIADNASPLAKPAAQADTTMQALCRCVCVCVCVCVMPVQYTFLAAYDVVPLLDVFVVVGL